MPVTVTLSPFINYEATGDKLGLAIRKIAPSWNIHSADLRHFINTTSPTLHETDPTNPAETRAKTWRMDTPFEVYVYIHTWLKAYQFSHPKASSYDTPHIKTLETLESEATADVYKWRQGLNDKIQREYLAEHPECPLNEMLHSHPSLSYLVQQAYSESSHAVYRAVRGTLTADVLRQLISANRESVLDQPKSLVSKLEPGAYTSREKLRDRMSELLSFDYSDGTEYTDGTDEVDGELPEKMVKYYSLVAALLLIIELHTRRGSNHSYHDNLGNTSSRNLHWSMLWQVARAEMKEGEIVDVEFGADGSSADGAAQTEGIAFFFRHLRFASALERLPFEQYERLLQTEDEQIMPVLQGIVDARNHYNVIRHKDDW